MQATNHKVWALGGALVLMLTAGASAAGARTPIANASAGGSEIRWTPLVTDYDRLVLTVAGPGGALSRHEFPSGVEPVFGLFEEDGSQLAEGVYKWELSLVPTVDRETRRRLREVRLATGGQGGVDELVAASPSRQSGSFSIRDGGFVATDLVEPAPQAAASVTADAGSGPDPQGVITNSDGVIRNSLCVGFDCPDSPAFSDSTILLMENNTRIKFGDTSNSPFPNRDWEIEANSASSGGASYLGFNDCGTSDNDGGCATDLVFAVEAGARQSALYVESDGDVGLGTSNPAVDVHVVTGNTPTLRLDQDGSSGFAPQVWDIAGNETNFFVRDVTGGSSLPFRIRPGAPSNSIFIDVDGDLGMGTSAPAQALHVRRTNGASRVQIEEASGSTANRTLLQMQNNGTSNLSFFNTDTNDIWLMATATVGSDDVFRISLQGSGVNELQLDQGGNLVVTGDIDSGGTTSVPDYVFEPDYELMPLDDLAAFVARERHLPRVPSAGEIEARGSVNMTEMQMLLLEKVEELTLYTISQKARIDELEAVNRRLVEVQERLARLEATVE